MNEPQYTQARDDDHPDNYSHFSGVLAPLYACPEHGQVWRVEAVHEIDTANDEVYEHYICALCHKDVRPIFHEGAAVCHPLTDEELYWDNYGADDEDEYYDEEMTE